MPHQYEFDLAGPDDDAELRSILSNTVMPGNVALSSRREPCFFLAERAGNLGSQVIIVRDTVSGSIVGFGARSWRQAYVDGEVRRVGYLNGLRGMPEVRGGTLLARGYRFLRQLHADEQVPYYFTTIFEDNEHARNILTSQRAGLPVYQALGRLNTYLLPLYGWHHYRFRAGEGENVGRISGEQLPAATRCLSQFNSRFQMAPYYLPEDLSGESGLLPGFHLGDLYGYRRSGEITATLGIWDQSEFKQWMIAGYSGIFRWIRWVGGALAPLGLSPRFPKIGKPIPHVYAAFLSHLPGREADLEELLSATLRNWHRRGYTYLIAGAHQANPLSRILARLAVICRRSTIYLVYWPDLLKASLPSADLAPHVEIATL